jgi:acetyl/propionyl-CoA carboxylase alpha subunit
MRKLLIANRGEIARRIQRSCRELGIATVAVYSEADASAPFVREADEAVPIGGPAPRDSYLRIDAIVEAARRTGADAVHPGYGFLAENAGLARACADAGLVFVGPPPDVLEASGSKLEARRRVQQAGVPVLPAREIAEAGPASLPGLATSLGLPLLVKASAGGGGRGMRLVRSPDELDAALESAQREALSAFGDATVYLERWLDTARHVEVQIAGDADGRVVHLYERDCSVQRRHQKIVEESPSPALDPALREAICKSAVAAGEALGYQGLGTVEFLLAPGGEFFFLEVNARLQVEHPVTERVLGLDLVRMQIEIARGLPLPAQEELPRPRGCAIEARLCAEDPARDFLPQTGALHRFAIDTGPELRVDSGVEDGSQISPHYDSLLAKVIAWAPDRAAAAEHLATALARARLHGPRTNRELLVRVLRHPDFLAGRADTRFFERVAPAELAGQLVDAAGERLHALAAALATQAARRASARVLGSLPSGWRNVPSQDQVASFTAPSGRIDVHYRFARDGLRASANGEPFHALRLHACSADHVDLEAGGVRRRYAVSLVGARAFVDSPLGPSELERIERLPEPQELEQAGSLAAPLPGTVVDVRVSAGDRVQAGDVLMVIEAMKMEEPIRAPVAGRVVELRAGVGDQVDAGRVLAVIEPEEPADA